MKTIKIVWIICILEKYEKLQQYPSRKPDDYGLKYIKS